MGLALCGTEKGELPHLCQNTRFGRRSPSGNVVEGERDLLAETKYWEQGEAGLMVSRPGGPKLLGTLQTVS